MRCSECAADVPPLREFCPSCGSPTNPNFLARRREARTSRSDEELRGNRKKVLIVGGAVLLALAALGKVGLPGPTIHIDTDDDRPKGAIITTAEDLARAYNDDPSGSARKYSNREIQVSGEFLRIVPDGYGSIDVRLKTANPDFPLGVDVSGPSVEDAKLLRPGQKVTVSCRGVAGSGNDRWLQDCAIQPGGEGIAAPPPPAPPPGPAPPPRTKPGTGN